MANVKMKTRDMTFIALGAALIAAGAWISIPLAPPLVPFTLQTFAVFAVMMTLGWRRGTYAMLTYILLGAVGVPVFAGFRGGISVLLGSTGGYILGFFAICAVYACMTCLIKDTCFVRIAACTVGLAVCYAFGTVWFYLVYLRTTGPVGITTVLSWCVAPYIVPDLCKLAAATVLANRLRRIIK